MHFGWHGLAGAIFRQHGFVWYEITILVWMSVNVEIFLNEDGSTFLQVYTVYIMIISRKWIQLPSKELL